MSPSRIAGVFLLAFASILLLVAILLPIDRPIDRIGGIALGVAGIFMVVLGVYFFRMQLQEN